MSPAEALRQLVTMAASDAGAKWLQLPHELRMQIPNAMRAGLIRDTGYGYRATTDRGMEFIAARETTRAKRCPRCEDVKQPDEFWKDAHTSDGLFVYCIPCETNRRREKKLMRQTAVLAIREAAAQAKTAAARWDAAVDTLVSAWTDMLAASTTMMTNRNAAGSECDWGPLEGRLIYQQAHYQLAMRLKLANYPVPGGVMFVENAPRSLAEWMTDDPAAPYLGGFENVEESNAGELPAGGPESGPAEGSREPDDQGRASSNRKAGGAKHRQRAGVAG